MHTAYLVEGREGQSERAREGRFVGEKANSWQEVTTLNHFISTSHYTPNLPLTPPFSSSPHPLSLPSLHFLISGQDCPVKWKVLLHSELRIFALDTEKKKLLFLSYLALGKEVLFV